MRAIFTRSRTRPSGENEIPAITPAAQRNWATRIFLGRDGLRSGWRVLIFFVLLIGIILACIRFMRIFGLHQPKGEISPGVSPVGEILLLLSVMIAAAVIRRFERRGFEKENNLCEQ